jgi:NhaA family Na+:H+ antiporter
MSSKYTNPKLIKLHSIFGQLEERINPGVLLLLVALMAIILSNSPLYEWYESILKTNIYLGTEHFNFFNHNGHSFTLLQFINDALMTIFFFAVGLEIKREILVGELSSFRQALLPIIAACGGMILPVVIFFTYGKIQGFTPEALRGIAIPMATDIAFSVGVLSLLGKKVPLSLKIFLLALAIVDDIGGIAVIAIFFSHFTSTSFIYLLVSFAFFALLLIGNRLHVNSKLFFASIGLIIWYCFLQAGIHPTIAGVLVAFTIPARPHLNLSIFTKRIETELSAIKQTENGNTNSDIILSNQQIEHLTNIDIASDHAVSPLQDFESNLHSFINFIIMPVFAFANAGVRVDLSNPETLSGVTVAVILGLFVGKFAGIFSFTWLAVQLKISPMPTGMTWKNLSGLSILGGIGFTVALFLAGLSYPSGSLFLNQAKLGVMLGSLLSGMVGYFLLYRILQTRTIKRALHKPKQ